MAQGLQLGGQLADALGCPSQGAVVRRPGGDRFEQGVEVLQQRQVGVDAPLAAAAHGPVLTGRPTAVPPGRERFGSPTSRSPGPPRQCPHVPALAPRRRPTGVACALSTPASRLRISSAACFPRPPIKENTLPSKSTAFISPRCLRSLGEKSQVAVSAVRIAITACIYCDMSASGQGRVAQPFGFALTYSSISGIRSLPGKQQEPGKENRS